MIIQVCIGSACHLKGSYEVIKTMQRVIEKENLEDRITLKSSFCLGQCSQAVSVQVDQQEVTSVSPQTAERFIRETAGLE